VTDQHYPAAHRTRELESLSLLAILDLLRRNKFVIVVPLVVASLAAIGFAYYLPDVYEARALIALDIPPASASPYDRTLNAQAQLSVIRDAINRRSFIEPVIAEFDLYETTADGHAGDHSLDEMRSRLQLSVEGPQTLYLSFSSTDPEVAAAVVTRVADTFVEETDASQQSRVQDRVEQLEAEVDSAQTELDEYQQQIDDYRRRQRGQIPENLDTLIASLGRATSQLQEVNRNIVGLEAERNGVLEELRLLESLGYDRPAATPATQNARRADIERQLTAARDRYSDQHPTVTRLEAELARLDDPAASPGSDTGSVSTGDVGFRPRYIQQRASMERIDTQLTFYVSEKDRLVEETKEFQRQIDAIPQSDQQLAALTRQAENARTRYFDRLQRVEQARLDARLSSAGGPVGFRVAEAARVPDRKAGPARRRIAAMGLLVGIALGLGLMLVRHQLDSTFNDVDELRQFSGLPTLASIPRVRGKWFRRRRRAVVPTIEDEASVASEQYRILTSRIRKIADRECAQVLLVTSAAGNEGKTTTAVNTAIALSQIQPGRVLLIDADLRKPQVREVLGALHEGSFGPEEGLRQLLGSPNGLPQECFGRVGRLYLLAAADGTPDSFSDMTSDAVRKSLARLRKQFKYIVIDSPPLLPMVDSHLLAELADRVILIVRANQTRRETLSRMLQTFDLSKVLGFVMNGVDYSQKRYGPAYEYYAREYLKTEKKPWQGARLRILL